MRGPFFMLDVKGTIHEAQRVGLAHARRVLGSRPQEHRKWLRRDYLPKKASINAAVDRCRATSRWPASQASPRRKATIGDNPHDEGRSLHLPGRKLLLDIVKALRGSLPEYFFERLAHAGKHFLGHFVLILFAIGHLGLDGRAHHHALLTPRVSARLAATHRPLPRLLLL